MSSPWTTLVGHVSKRESRFDRVVQSCFAQVAGLSGSLTDRFAETPAACFRRFTKRNSRAVEAAASSAPNSTMPSQVIKHIKVNI